MKTLHLSAFDIQGGAAKAAFRLYKALKVIGLQSKMLVKRKSIEDHEIIGPGNLLEKLRSRTSGTLDLLPSKIIYRKNFSNEWIPDGLIRKINDINPDIVNLHWINSGFMKIESIGKIKQPIVWTFHDMWPFTGGCHYSYSCDRYEDECGYCPQLYSHIKWDLSYFNYKRKKRNWRNKNITIVTPSNWLAEKALNSSLFGEYCVETIPNGLNLEIYKPVEKVVARRILNLSQEEKRVLLITRRFEKADRKGSKYFSKLENCIYKTNLNENVEFILVGTGMPNYEYERWKNYYFLGKISDDYSMVLAYSAADLYISLSEAENLPNTIMESFACGTPVVAFSVGGIPEMIDHKKNGYLAKPFDVNEIINGIFYILADKQRYLKIKNLAREKAEKEYDYLLQARRYGELYSKLANK